MQNTISKQQIKLTKPESLFRVLLVILVIILSICFKRILQFRAYCQQNNLYVFSSDSLIYSILGFILFFMAKYSFFYLFESKLQSMLNVKYVGEDRVLKTKSTLKLTFDTLFYTTTSIFAYFLFNQENWFPKMIGGNGECSTIYDNYPDWPKNKRTQMEIYFMIHLGVHAFSVFEMLFIRRNTQRKFYQFLLHHFVAVSLILCSMMCNQIAAGVMILIVHDFSDIFLAMTRAYGQINNHKMYIIYPMAILLIAFWIYMRLIVFPFCLLANVYYNKPTINDDWYMIYYPYIYLLCMAFVLVGLHIYWLHFLIKSVISSSKKRRTTNQYEGLHQKE